MFDGANPEPSKQQEQIKEKDGILYSKKGCQRLSGGGRTRNDRLLDGSNGKVGTLGRASRDGCFLQAGCRIVSRYGFKSIKWKSRSPTGPRGRTQQTALAWLECLEIDSRGREWTTPQLPGWPAVRCPGGQVWRTWVG